MKTRPEFPDLMPPDAPHAQRCCAPGWWVVPATIVGAIFWGAVLFLLF